MADKIIFENAPHHIENITVSGTNKRIAVFGYPKLAAFADTAEGFKHYGDWQESCTSKYFPNGEYPRSHKSARSMVENFKFPQDLRTEANRLSGELVGALEVEGAPKTLRGQMYGRFDPKAMKRVVQDLSINKFSRERTRPYTSRERVAPTPPHVAIIADGSAAAMWSSAEYIPRVAAMMLGVTWACEAVNCMVTTAIARDSSVSRNQDMDLIIYVINDDEVKTPLNSLAPLFHRDLYRAANLTVFGSHIDTIKLLNRGYTQITTRDISSSGGGHGYSWAKSRGADIIISIGQMKIVHDTNPVKAAEEKKNLIQINPNTNLKDAIKEIASKLLEIKYQKQAA